MSDLASDRRQAVVTAVLAGAGMLGGLAHAGKGAALLLTGRDLSLVPAMILLFSLGMLALHRLVSPATVSARVGRMCTGAALAAGVAALGCQLLGWQPEDPRDPVVVDIAYGLGTFAILAGLLSLGLAWHRGRRHRRPWRSVPLIAALTWFPLESLTAVLPDGWGLLLAGLTWVAATAVPLRAAVVRHRRPVRARPARRRGARAGAADGARSGGNR